jgi:hypothetical protein
LRKGCRQRASAHIPAMLVVTDKRWVSDDSVDKRKPRADLIRRRLLKEVTDQQIVDRSLGTRESSFSVSRSDDP